MKKAIVIFLSAALILAYCPRSWAISWERSLAAALEKAKSEGKPVMADFYTDWCGWCKKLDSDVYEDAGVNVLAGKFICVKVNCEVDKSAFSKYGLQGYPTVIFFGSAGNVQETVVGYRNAQVFTTIMNKVLGKAPAADMDRQQPAAKPGVKRAHVLKVKKAAGIFELSGIMGSRAIINGKVVAAGDKVDNADVVAITQDSVKLRYKDKDLTLKL